MNDNDQTIGKPGGPEGTPPPSVDAPAPLSAPAPEPEPEPQPAPETPVVEPTGPGPGQLSDTNAEAGEGETGIVGSHEGDAAGHIEVAGDPTGEVTNRDGGTLQREAKPEDLPPDAKIAPLAEQVNPNAASQAVGAAPTPDVIAGVEQPEEGEKNVQPDTSDSTQFLAPDSDQHEDATRADEDAAQAADRGQE